MSTSPSIQVNYVNQDEDESPTSDIDTPAIHQEPRLGLFLTSNEGGIPVDYDPIDEVDFAYDEDAVEWVNEVSSNLDDDSNLFNDPRQ